MRPFSFNNLDSTFRMNTQKPIPTRFLDPLTGDTGSFFPYVGACAKEDCAECEDQFRSECAQQNYDYLRYTRGLSISEVSKIFQYLGDSLKFSPTCDSEQYLP
jgi:hypothetical protein